MVESLLLTVSYISTYTAEQPTSNATGFFYENGESLFLITNRHVLSEPTTGHHPDRIVLQLHIDEDNIAATTDFAIQLYHTETDTPIWRELVDPVESPDIAAIALDRNALPETFVYRAYNARHLVVNHADISAGTPVLIAGFPMGFHDELHRLPVVRQGVIASSFGLQFQGRPVFLTDARMHRGTSGAPVVAQRGPLKNARNQLNWTLLGIHGSRFEADSRDPALDDRLALNCTWYADALERLTAPERADSESEAIIQGV